MINLVLSSHRISDAQICPRLLFYKNVLLRVPLKNYDYNMEGELIHHIMKLYYKSIMDKQEIDLKLLMELGRNYAAKNLELNSELVEKAIKAAEMYFEYYNSLGESWEVIGVEEPFAKTLFENDSIRVIITGTIDLIVKTNYGNGPTLIVDHKYESQFRAKRERDNQPLCYCWATGLRDFIYNRIGKQASYKPKDRLKREPWISYTEEQINEWEDATLATALEIIRYNEAKVYPPRITGCQVFGRKCTYYDVCNTSPKTREFKLKTFFKEAPPYDKDLMDREEG